MKRSDTICTFFTHAGNLSPMSAPAVSPLPLEQRARAVADAGFAGIGFGREDINRSLEQYGAAGVRAILDDYGLIHRELEVLLNWFVDDSRRKESDLHRAQLLDAAEIIGARHIKVAGDVSGKVWPMNLLIDEFAGLCEQAANVGTAITIELYPSSNLADLQTGFAIVNGAGKNNGGLLLDIWHMLRGHVPLSAIASLPGGIVNHVELDDGAMLPVSDYFSDTINQRLNCGEGEFPIKAFLSALDSIGYDGLFGVEILSEQWRLKPVEVATAEAFAGLKPFMSD